MPPNTNETKLRSGEQEAFPSADKNSDVDLVLFWAWGWVPAAISALWIFPGSAHIICCKR